MKNLENRKKKVFLNAYLAENFGDDLFLYIIAKRYENTDFYVLSLKSYKGSLPSNIFFCLTKFDDQLLKYENKILALLNSFNLPARRLFPKGIRLLYRKRNQLSKKYDSNIYIIGSGFMDRGILTKNELRTDLKYFSRNVHLLGCNFGPYYSEMFRMQYEKLFSKAKEICFRDSYSYELFKNLNNVRWESDIVFSYNGDIDTSFSKENSSYVVISVVNLDKDGTVHSSKSEYYDFIANIAKWYLRRGIQVAFVGFCKQQGDNVAIDAILDVIPLNFSDLIHVINYPHESIESVLGLFKNADAVFASRYHAGIIGILFKCKTYFLAYSDKMVNVLHDIDSNIRYIDISSKIDITAEDFILKYGYSISDKRLNDIKESANRQFSLLDNMLK